MAPRPTTTSSAQRSSGSAAGAREPGQPVSEEIIHSRRQLRMQDWPDQGKEVVRAIDRQILWDPGGAGPLTTGY